MDIECAPGPTWWIIELLPVQYCCYNSAWPSVQHMDWPPAGPQLDGDRVTSYKAIAGTYTDDVRRRFAAVGH